MVLKAKRIKFNIVEVTPGIGQINIFKLSGQRKLPILIDGNKVISDSSEIVKYLEPISVESKLFPDNHKEAIQAHIIEDWADTTLAKACRLALIKSAAIDPELRGALLPDEYPTNIRQVIEGIPCGFFNDLTDFVTKGEGVALIENLIQLSKFVEQNQWLVGNNMTIADISVAAQLSLLKFPYSSGPIIAGRGCKGISDNPQLSPLFKWRDHLDKKLIASDEVTLQSENSSEI